MKKWVNVRDAFQKSFKKLEEAARSGAGAVTTKKYIYNEQLQFLKKVFTERETEDSLNETEHRETGTTTSDTTLIDSEINQDNVAEAKPRRNATTFQKPAVRKRKPDPIELQMLEAIKEIPDRHMSFLKE